MMAKKHAHKPLLCSSASAVRARNHLTLASISFYYYLIFSPNFTCKKHAVMVFLIKLNCICIFEANSCTPVLNFGSYTCDIKMRVNGQTILTVYGQQMSSEMKN